MSAINSTSKIEFQVTLRLSESEARALKAITDYGINNFTDVFYEKLGKTHLQPYEEGLKSLFEIVKVEMPKHLDRFDNVRKIWTEAKF